MKSEERVNGTRRSIQNVPTGKTGLPFQTIRIFQEFSSWMNPKNVFHFEISGNFLANGKQPVYPDAITHFFVFVDSSIMLGRFFIFSINIQVSEIASSSLIGLPTLRCIYTHYKEVPAMCIYFFMDVSDLQSIPLQALH